MTIVPEQFKMLTLEERTALLVNAGETRSCGHPSNRWRATRSGRCAYLTCLECDREHRPSKKISQNKVTPATNFLAGEPRPTTKKVPNFLEKVEALQDTNEKEIYRMEIAALCPSDASAIACLPGPRITEPLIYANYRAPKARIFCVENKTEIADGWSFLPKNAEKIVGDLDKVLQGLFFDDVILDFIHADLIGKADGPNVRHLCHVLTKALALVRRGGILVVNVFNGHTEVEPLEFIGSLLGSNWERLKDGKYRHMIWGAWEKQA